MRDDPIEQLAEAWDQTDVLAQKLALAAQPDQTWTGTAGAGSVTVSVDTAARVTIVEVQPDWRQRIRGDELAGAVREASEVAGLARLRGFAEALAEQDAEAPPRARPMPLLHESLAYQLDQLATARMTGDDGRAALRELLHMLESVERDIDRVTEQLQVQRSAMYTGYNATRDVAVTISAGSMVSDVSYNRHWLLDVSAPTIGRETAAAFRAAYAQAGEDSAEAMIARSAIGEVQALGQDPFGLARRLHLREG